MAEHVTKKRKLGHSFMDQHGEILTPSLARNGDSSSVKNGLLQSNSNNIAVRAGVMNNSSMFRMQMDELISEVQPKYPKCMTKLDNILYKLKSTIEMIPAKAPLSISEAESYMLKNHNISIPFPEPRPGDGVRYTLGYEKPANINVVGSYVRKTDSRTDDPMVIDMAITMPSTLFQEKDYLNYRYFYRRAYYIASLAAGIQSAESCNVVLSMSYQNECPLQPVLILASVKDGGEDDFSSMRCDIRVLLAAEKNAFSMSKTLPWKNCLRHNSQNEAVSSNLEIPTPLYNATLRAECSVALYSKLLYVTQSRSDGFRNACILGTVWLHQRGFGTGLRQGGFGAFEFAVTLSLLIQGGGLKGQPLLSTSYSSYQLFKALINFLATKDLFKEPLILFKNTLNPSDASNIGVPMLFDGARGMNVLYKMMPWSYKMLRLEAQATLKVSGETTVDPFMTSFISRVDKPLLQFDVLMRLKIPASWKPSSEQERYPDLVMDFCVKLYKVLVKGLGDRVALVSLKPVKVMPWLITGPNSSTNDDPVIIVGILVDAALVNRAVDHGPPAEDKKAAASFRKFWGEKAELRRFKDGSIHESLVWTEKSESKDILQQILRYIIGRHMGRAVEECTEFIANDFHQPLPSVHRQTNLSLIPFTPLQSAYELLERQIRSLEGLPLQIRKISASCAGLRYSSISPHVSNTSMNPYQPLDVTVQFEGSSRWPDNISAIQRTKIAFLLKLGELLEGSIKGVTTWLGLESEAQGLSNFAFLDFTYPDSITFRLRIHHDRESTLLERQSKDKSADPRSRQHSASALSTYKRVFIQSPSHTQALRTLCTRFPLLSPSIRLMKQWCNMHLLSHHLSPELIELLTIRTFIYPYPWQIPGSLRVGFLRTLDFISKWDWRSEPLIVDFNGEMSTENVNAISVRLAAWRKIDPAMNRTVIFAASNLDPEGITWTNHGPSKVVAARLTALARAAMKLVEKQGMEVEVRSLFTHPLTDYDFVVYLDLEKCYGRGVGEKKRSAFKNLQGPLLEDDGLIGYDPILLYVEELQRLHGESVIFFFTVSEALAVVTGLWSPQTESRGWKVNLGYSTVPERDDRGGGESGGEPRVAINTTAILNDIGRLGGDMVSRIEMNP